MKVKERKGKKGRKREQVFILLSVVCFSEIEKQTFRKRKRKRKKRKQ